MIEQRNKPLRYKSISSLNEHKPTTKAFKLAQDLNISIVRALFLIEAYNTPFKSVNSLNQFLMGYNVTFTQPGLTQLVSMGLINTGKSSSILTKKGRELVSKYI